MTEEVEVSQEPKKEKMTLAQRLAEIGDETGRELGAVEISDEDFMDVVKLAVALSSDGDLSAEDTEKIMEAVASKEGILTERHAEKLLKAIHQSTRETYTGKVTAGMRVFGILAFVASLGVIGKVVFSFADHGQNFLAGQFQYFGTVELVVTFIALLFSAATVVLNLILGAKLIRGKRARAAEISYVLTGFTVGLIFFETLLTGIGIDLLILLGVLIIQIVLACYLHPSLENERHLEAALYKEETKRRAETGTLGRELNQKDGYIKLDFFNIFWIFIIGCIVGLIVEIIWHMVVVEPGVYQDRAGLLWGPFSPIYGVGCVLMTMILNRYKHVNFILIFIACTIIGGAFEYFVSWWMETAFGIIAWDYHGKFLGDLLDGRTCLVFAMMFGALGCAWIKLLLPVVLKGINAVPWKWRYGITTVCAIFMLFDCVMTVQALDCWFMRAAGKPVETAVQQFYAENYGDDWMAKRFESMNIDPNRAARS